MKKLFVFASIVIGMVTGAFGQSQNSKGTPEEKAQRAGNVWQKKLGLSEDEKSKFVEAKKTYLIKVQDLRKTKPVDRAAVASAKASLDSSVKVAFTPEHYAAWTKAKEEYKTKRAAKKGGKDGQKGPNCASKGGKSKAEKDKSGKNKATKNKVNSNDSDGQGTPQDSLSDDLDDVDGDVDGN